MPKKPKFKPEITRVRLNPEQAVLACGCYDVGTNFYMTEVGDALPYASAGAGTTPYCNRPTNKVRVGEVMDGRHHCYHTFSNVASS